jgi:hypothetical protein
LPLLIDSSQACEMLFGADTRRNRYRLYAMIARGEIKGRKFGERWYIPRREMESLHDEHASASPA